LAFAAAFTLALAAAGALARRFGRHAPQPQSLLALAIVAVVILLFSYGLLRQYGLAASPDAVLIWREATARPLPIEQPDDDQAPVLVAGTLARVEQTLLGWHRLRFDTGDTAWVQRSDLIWLWRDNLRPSMRAIGTRGTPGSVRDRIQGLAHQQ
jgi:hypothetical protein